jgi:hypothetical protein
MDSEKIMPVTAEIPSGGQRLFLRYFTAILIDLVVLNLFDEYSDKVTISGFTVSLGAAVLLQILLKLTIALEHSVAAFFKKRPGGFMTFMRWFSAWAILFGSKFVILEALARTFGDNVHFEGLFHGLLVLIAVVVVMLIAEEAIVRFYRKLG